MLNNNIYKNIKFTLTAVGLLTLLGIGGCFETKTGDRSVDDSSQSTVLVEKSDRVKSDRLKPEETLVQENFHITSDVVNIYREPWTDSETVTQALHGEPVRVINRQDSWVEITLPDQWNYRGWVQESVLQKIPTAKILADRKIVSVPEAIVRKSPSEEAEILLTLSLGNIVGTEPAKKHGDFVQIQMVNGTQGYVKKAELVDYVERKTTEVSSDRLLKTASQLLGQPYLWGGMSTAGVDCSGFIHTIFKVHGIRLHRDADLQYLNDGVSVAENELQPGDLVFFETYMTGPSHVGIYAGDRQMLHASSQTGVSYASLDDTYFSERFLGAKRILQIKSQ